MSNPLRKNYIIQRMSNGYREKGRFISGTRTDITVNMSIQPVTGKELESLKIGRSNLGKLKGYSSELLQSGEPNVNYTGDLFVFLGDLYEVISVEKWQSGIINHYKYYAEYRKKI